MGVAVCSELTGTPARSCQSSATNLANSAAGHLMRHAIPSTALLRHPGLRAALQSRLGRSTLCRAGALSAPPTGGKSAPTDDRKALCATGANYPGLLIAACRHLTHPISYTR